MTTEKPSKDLPQRSSQTDGASIVVFISMFLVSVSVSLALILHLGLSAILAGVVGFSLFIGLAGFQLWQRGFSETQALKGEVEFLEAELERLRAPSGKVSLDFTVPSKSRETPVQASFLEEKTHSVSASSISNVKEKDVEKLQSRIKEMLTQVSDAEQAREEPEVFSQESEAKIQSSSSLEKALESLRNAAQSLRPKVEKLSDSVVPEIQSDVYLDAPSSFSDEKDVPKQSLETSVQADSTSFQQAIQNGQVDVLLEPILSLSEHAAKHYEVSVVLKGPTQEDLGSFESEDFRSSGVWPLVDSARFQRSVIVAERLANQGRKGSVFTQVRGQSLLDQNFNYLIQKDMSGRQNLFPQMVLSFTQSDIRTFRSDEQVAVSRLAGLGFRFAITHLTDLDMNFDAMSKAGFSYVKLKASVLSQGLSYPQGLIQAKEVTSYLTKFGFTLVVEDIDSEDTLARIYGYGVLYGQGSLFGGRRPVRADLVTRTGQAAA